MVHWEYWKRHCNRLRLDICVKARAAAKKMLQISILPVLCFLIAACIMHSFIYHIRNGQDNETTITMRFSRSELYNNKVSKINEEIKQLCLELSHNLTWSLLPTEHHRGLDMDAINLLRNKKWMQQGDSTSSYMSIHGLFPAIQFLLNDSNPNQIDLPIEETHLYPSSEIADPRLRNAMANFTGAMWGGDWSDLYSYQQMNFTHRFWSNDRSLCDYYSMFDDFGNDTDILLITFGAHLMHLYDERMPEPCANDSFLNFEQWVDHASTRSADLGIPIKIFMSMPYWCDLGSREGEYKKLNGEYKEYFETGVHPNATLARKCADTYGEKYCREAAWDSDFSQRWNERIYAAFEGTDWYILPYDVLTSNSSEYCTKQHGDVHNPTLRMTRIRVLLNLIQLALLE